MSFASVSVAVAFALVALVAGLVLKAFLGTYSVSLKKDWLIVGICVLGVALALTGSASVLLGDPFNIMAV